MFSRGGYSRIGADASSASRSHTRPQASRTGRHDDDEEVWQPGSPRGIALRTYGATAGSAASPSVTTQAPTAVSLAIGDAGGRGSSAPLIRDYHTLALNTADEEAAKREGLPASCAWLLRCDRRRLTWRAAAIYASVFVLLLMGLMAILGTYVIAPEYVRQRMAATSLRFDRVILTSPSGIPGVSPCSASMSASATLSGLSPVDGTLDPMLTTLSYKGVQVASLTLPRVRALANVENFIGVQAPVAILDADGFTAFGADVLTMPSVNFDLVGSATVSTTLAGITYRISDVPFQKTIALAGADGLRNSQVLEFSLTGSNATAAIASLVVALDNPALLGIEPIGDLAVNVVYKGANMGVMLCNNASLVPGRNVLRFGGQLQPSDTSIAQDLISRYLAGAEVNVTAYAIPWPTTAPLYVPLLKYVALNATLQGSTTPLVNAIVVNSMFLTPASLQAVQVDLDATVVVNNPLGANSPLLVSSVALNVSLEGGGAVVGSLVVPPTPVASVQAGHLGVPQPDSPWFARFVHPSCVGRPGVHRLAECDMLADPAPPMGLANISLAVSALLTIDETAVQFGDFILQFLNEDAVELGLVSDDPYAMRVDLQSALGNLSVHIPLMARTVVPGIAGFPDVSVKSFAVAAITETPAAVVVNLTVAMFNPSPASFPLGENTTLGIYVEGQRIGGSLLHNVTLLPGMNELNLTGIIAPPPEALPATSSLFTQYLKGLPGTATVVGESVYVGNGLPTPPWLQDAVANLSLAATLPGATDLDVFAEVQLLAMSFDFSNGDGIPLISGVVAGNLHLPFSIPVDVASINTSLVFTDPDTGVGMAGVTLTNQKAKYTPASSLPGSTPAVSNAPIVGTLEIFLDPAPVELYDLPSFQAFIANVLNKPSAPVLLKGSASPVVQLVIGNLSIVNVSVAQMLSIPGMNGLSSPPVVVTSADVLATTKNSALLSVGLNVTNPSILAGNLGPVSLEIASEGYLLASTTVPALIVTPGMNQLTAQGNFTLPDEALEPEKYSVAIDFLARYLSAKSSAIRMLGSASSSPYPLLQPAFAALNASANFPGISRQILINGTLFSKDPFSVAPVLPGALAVANPLSVPVSLVNASLYVYMCLNESAPLQCNVEYGPAIGYFYDGDLSRTPINIPGKAVAMTSRYNITVLADFWDELIVYAEQSAYNSSSSKVNGTLTAALGDLVATVPYEQIAVPLQIVLEV